MTWTLTSYLERRAKEMPTNPKVLLFGVMLSAFAAGAQLVYELVEGNRTPLGLLLGCIMVAIWLAISLECSYFLLGAVRRSRSDD